MKLYSDLNAVSRDDVDVLDICTLAGLNWSRSGSAPGSASSPTANDPGDVDASRGPA